MSDDRSAGHDDAMPLAGEYVLGVLSAVERRDFERRLAQEPALRTEVEYWERRLGGLAFPLREAAVHALLPPLFDLLRLRRPRGMARIAGFAEGFFAGLRTPVDRKTLLFKRQPPQ